MRQQTLTLVIAIMLSGPLWGGSWLFGAARADGAGTPGPICVVVDGDEIVCVPVPDCVGPNIVTFETVPNLGTNVAGTVFFQPNSASRNFGVFVKIPAFANTFALLAGWTDGQCWVERCPDFEGLAWLLDRTAQEVPIEAIVEEAFTWFDGLQDPDPAQIEEQILGLCA